MKNLKLIILTFCVLAMTSCIPLDDVQTLEGEWTCTETSTIFKNGSAELKGTSVFPVYIAQDALINSKYYIDNFYQLGSGYQGTISVTGGSVTLASQIINGIQFVGSGTVSTDSNTINIVYTADDGGGEVDQVTAEYTR